MCQLSLWKRQFIISTKKSTILEFLRVYAHFNENFEQIRTRGLSHIIASKCVVSRYIMAAKNKKMAMTLAITIHNCRPLLS